MLAISIDFQHEARTLTLEAPTLCRICEVLLLANELGDNEWDSLAETRLNVCRTQLARSRRTSNGNAKTCWRCSHPGKIKDIVWHDDFWPEISFNRPCLCDPCAALLDLLPYGGADSDEQAFEARHRVFAMLVEAQATETRPQLLAPERQRRDELILARLALLERDLHDLAYLDHGDDYDELARGLGLSREEAEAEVARLLAVQQPMIMLHPREGALVPTLNAHGWRRVRELMHAQATDKQLDCFRSRGLQRALFELRHPASLSG
jgi:hypothetical protein